MILADFSLPDFSGEGAIKIAQERCPGTPVVVVSGTIGDEAAVELIRQGATDYILKDRPARLAPVIRRAVAEAEQRSRVARMQAQLRRRSAWKASAGWPTASPTNSTTRSAAS